MEKINKKILIVLLSIMFILIFTESIYMIDWQDFKLKNKNNLKKEIFLEKEIMYNYNLAIAYANLGEINNSQNTLDEIEDKFGKKKFNKIISSYIKKNSYNSDLTLLDLNYAAFYYLIYENYSKSSFYFEKIIEREPKNIWAINYLAGNYIMLEKYDKAESYLIEADNIQSNKFTNLLYGYIYYERGNYIKAFSKLAKTGDLLKENIFQ